MTDETCACQLVSINLTAFLSSSDDLAVLTRPCKERRHDEQLNEGEAINGIHPPYFRSLERLRERAALLQGRPQGVMRIVDELLARLPGEGLG